MKVRFLPQDKVCEIKPGQSVLQVAQENGIYIKSVCGGRASCAECRVKVAQGDSHCLPPASPELALIGSGYFIDHRRLSCQLRVLGDIDVDLTEQVEKERKLRGLQRRDSAEAQSVREESVGEESVGEESAGDDPGSR